MNNFYSNINTFINEACWQVVNNSITKTLRLHFGKVKKSDLGSFGSRDAGQYEILIWCQWRLDDGNVSLCSNDNSREVVMSIAECLVGDTLSVVETIPPLCDAIFTFSSGKKLRVFCDQGQDFKPCDYTSTSNWSFGIMEDWHYIEAQGQIKKGKESIIPCPLTDPSLIKGSESNNGKDINFFLPSYKILDLQIIEATMEQFRSLIGKQCSMVTNVDEWILLLDFGGITKRVTTEKERAQSGTEFCYCGELDILIWCAWRLQNSHDALCSSDSTPEQQKEGTNQLLGQTVVAVDFSPPAWDAVVHFSSDLTLQIFCNYTHFSEIETNWFFRNGWKLHCFNRCDDIEKIKIDWNFLE
jgi:hypothetical protein